MVKFLPMSPMVTVCGPLGIYITKKNSGGVIFESIPLLNDAKNNKYKIYYENKL